MTGPRLSTAHWPARGRLDETADLTIGGAVARAADRQPDRLALVYADGAGPSRSWTFEELRRRSEAVAVALTERFRPGDRVALWAGNSPEWLLLLYGTALAGITLVTVNPANREQELEHVLRRSGAAAVFVQSRLRDRDLGATAERVAAALPGGVRVQRLETWDGFERPLPGRAERRSLPRVHPGDPAQIQFTSGTTGLPKGAQLNHRGLVVDSRAYADAIGANADDVWVNPMPLFHTAGCGLATLGALQTGGTQVLPPAFDADHVLDLVEGYRATVTLTVPTMLVRVLNAQREKPRDVTSWRLASLGGAPIPVELVRRAEAELGVKPVIGFGQTEASPYISHTRPDDPHPAWRETVGAPLPYVEVRIAREDATTAAVDETGEILTRGICVMDGYVGDEEATAEAVDDDGWLHTGDLGSLDAHGYLRVLGRARDMIIRGGENVYPREVEDVLHTHPQVVDVAVVGLPDEEWGEIVAAFVQTSGPVTGDELRAHLHGTVATYKVPQVWELLDDLPRTLSGKVRKVELRERYLADRP